MKLFSESTFQALAFIRNTVILLPGVMEKICFETPAFYVQKKIFARLNEDGKNLVLYTEEREVWMRQSPEIYHITPHYENFKYMLVVLDLVEPDELAGLLRKAWQNRAPKTLVKQYLASEL